MTAARAHRCWSVVSGLGLALLLCSCGDSQDTSSRFNRVLGGTKEGAPLAPGGSADTGILSDATAYKPTTPPGAPDGGGPGAPARPATPADVKVELEAFANEFAGLVAGGQVTAALDRFNAEQVALLKNSADPLLNTFEKLDLVGRHLGAKLDPQVAEQTLATLLKAAAAAPEVNVLDADHASITPNLSTLLFGPVRPTPAMAVVREAAGWRFQIEPPLTQDDVDQIVAYHRQLQATLDQVMNTLDTAEQVDPTQIIALLAQALQGEAPPPAPDQPPAETQPAAEGERPAGAAPPAEDEPPATQPETPPP